MFQSSSAMSLSGQGMRGGETTSFGGRPEEVEEKAGRGVCRGGRSERWRHIVIDWSRDVRELEPSIRSVIQPGWESIAPHSPEPRRWNSDDDDDGDGRSTFRRPGPSNRTSPPKDVGAAAPAQGLFTPWQGQANWPLSAGFAPTSTSQHPLATANFSYLQQYWPVLPPPPSPFPWLGNQVNSHGSSFAQPVDPSRSGSFGSAQPASVNETHGAHGGTGDNAGSLSSML